MAGYLNFGNGAAAPSSSGSTEGPMGPPSAISSRRQPGSIQWLLNPQPPSPTPAVAASVCRYKKPSGKMRNSLPLPLELKIQVYDYLFARNDIAIPIQTHRNWTISADGQHKPGQHPTIMCCSSTSYEETVPILYGKTLFDINLEYRFKENRPLRFPGIVPKNLRHMTRIQTFGLTPSETMELLSRFSMLKEVKFWVPFTVEEWFTFLRAASSKLLKFKRAIFVLCVAGDVSDVVIRLARRNRNENVAEEYARQYGAIMEEAPRLFPNHHRVRMHRKRARPDCERYGNPGTISLIIE